MIRDAQGRVLFTRRAKDPAKGKLGMPGGFVDLDETAEAGLCREVREEIGLELRDIKFLMSWPNEYVYRGIVYPTVDFFFTAEVRSFAEARALAEVDALEARDPSTIKPKSLPSNRCARRCGFTCNTGEFSATMFHGRRPDASGTLPANATAQRAMRTSARW